MHEPTMGGKQKMPKVAKVKNKAPAPVQITAEQLLREAKERELENVAPPPRQKISDPDELDEYKLRRRKAFEDNLRKNRAHISTWMKYAAFEDNMKEIQRARSVHERALDVEYRNLTLWYKYAEMEMKNKQINHARNVWDRAVTILPRANQLWYKYTYMEEMLGNIPACRQVFERWMEWEPHEQAWQSYINFELRYKEVDRARTIHERFVYIHPQVKNWIKYGKFEEKFGYITNSRKIFERAVRIFRGRLYGRNLFISFAKFEERQKEFERARVIYKYALDHIDKKDAGELFKAYTIFEKKFGNRSGIENVIVSKRKFQYEEEVKENPHNYDAWFDYLRLSEEEGDPEKTREVYERAISNIPPVAEKRHWRRYIYLWINYALYEELITKDSERTREVYKACLEVIPHKKFTFAKVWLMFAHFEIRQRDLKQARKILGVSIGKCPKDRLFRGYIELELQLREFDRCRVLYEKFLEHGPDNCTTWCRFAELETLLGDADRARAIYEIAVNQPRLDMPEVLWKAYIDFEMEQEENENARKLYRRLLDRTQHVKVWMSFATFESSNETKDGFERARQVYKEAHNTLKDTHEKEERMLLLEAWKKFELENGDAETIRQVDKQMPKRIKKRRKVTTESGVDAGWEEYYDYIFPEDEAAQPNLKLLAMAKQWKMKQDESDNESDGDSVSEDNESEEDSEEGTSQSLQIKPEPTSQKSESSDDEGKIKKELVSGDDPDST
uniref:LOW QUALITY PROTEIN: crooked neck-like protein 1 n=1 Tax=Styela clava TaxID=7725 RepID=UPI0019396A49|nr:LOW QUALITY PROTEIN: crooked neck-like protein 1 [Styela clava]